jgi:1-deoxy-D-xylulose 5-phosphate reductoisomerase
LNLLPCGIFSRLSIINEQQWGLGEKFETMFNKHLASLEKNPFFQVRYDQVHCLPLNKFPFMVHFTVDKNENSVIVRAVFHTSVDPVKWKKR